MAYTVLARRRPSFERIGRWVGGAALAGAGLSAAGLMAATLALRASSIAGDLGYGLVTLGRRRC